MSDLVAFLLARIDEDESVAQDMAHQAGVGRPLLQLLGGGTGIRRLVDPARVLADCTARRAIIKEHQPVPVGDAAGEHFNCDACLYWQDRDNYPDYWAKQAWPCVTMLALASVYADHADFDASWGGSGG